MGTVIKKWGGGNVPDTLVSDFKEKFQEALKAEKRFTIGTQFVFMHFLIMFFYFVRLASIQYLLDPFVSLVYSLLHMYILYKYICVDILPPSTSRNSVSNIHTGTVYRLPSAWNLLCLRISYNLWPVEER